RSKGRPPPSRSRVRRGTTSRPRSSTSSSKTANGKCGPEAGDLLGPPCAFPLFVESPLALSAPEPYARARRQKGVPPARLRHDFGDGVSGRVDRGLAAPALPRSGSARRRGGALRSLQVGPAGRRQEARPALRAGRTYST